MTLQGELRKGSTDERQLEVSKWLQIQVLIDAEEMSQLFMTLGDFQIYKTGIVCQAGEGEVSKEDFLQLYASYINLLKSGHLPDESQYRQIFSSVFTVKRDHLFQIEVPGNRRIIRVARPVMQLQSHKIGYSPVDGKFRPMGLGKDCIFWGIQFSYPQLYQDADKEVHKALDEENFPDSALFKRLQQWVRKMTIPTPFVVGAEKTNVPMRLGKNCLSWINQHPQLIEKHIHVLITS